MTTTHAGRAGTRSEQPPRATGIPAAVDVVRETAISTVILAGDRVWKLRKPVVFPFLDQRSTEQQRQLCGREVRLNSRLAPDVYLGVVEVMDPTTGTQRPATLMRRLPDDRRLSVLIAAGTDVRHELREIAHRMAAFHLSATCGERVAAAGTPEALGRRWHDTLATLQRFGDTTLSATELTRVAELADEYLAGRHPLLAKRIAGDKIVDGHGDLLADDIFCLDGGPAILDCLEFSDDLRYCDGLCDIASLVMECERLGHAELGEYLLREYAAYTADIFPSSLADYYVAYRAVVRCEVACLRHAQGAAGAQAEARLLLSIALRHLERARVIWVLIGGAPGSGKSTLAAGIGAALRLTVLRSDEVRRELIAGSWQGTSEWLSDHFSPDSRAAVYRELVHRAELLGGLGEPVVIDATWASASMRELARVGATRQRCALIALRCQAPGRIAEHRVARRIAAGLDISRATVAVARRIAASFEPWPDAVVIDTGQPLPEALTGATAAIAAESGRQATAA